MSDPNLAPHWAETVSNTSPTGRLRFRNGILEQEWGCYWSNELGDGIIKDWFPVPTVDALIAKETDDA